MIRARMRTLPLGPSVEPTTRPRNVRGVCQDGPESECGVGALLVRERAVRLAKAVRATAVKPNSAATAVSDRCRVRCASGCLRWQSVRAMWRVAALMVCVSCPRGSNIRRFVRCTCCFGFDRSVAPPCPNDSLGRGFTGVRCRRAPLSLIGTASARAFRSSH